jgi:predicted TPR repeat methyltransferase
MLGKAHARNLYQRLERLDLLTMMRHEGASSYDVIIATDVFIYLGKLDEIFGEIKRLLCPGGFAAFSIETLEALSNGKSSQDVQQDYQLEVTGRYSHSPDYVTRLASANGLQVQKAVATHIRMENGKPINGHLVLLKN